ncbi:protein-methionine-sulfoxide reductase catalytic subunit MsrP [Methylomonas sp. SURF-2]|uniref:Protein-methionine-sulfoxide reductase catalytic subunit MsrP n=1 Tax=Methylomonas subterranea TaxID=2952225 RepID=A0ABT1TB56_9GAMM|nr:protein-methionine-sulfoxide reductase catalytic subunit MsrP [Methylomonas sp. SURF-2]MCQ8102697.1 protein-methionine-sulfoxide reductase catalytic subunit MsrP [Methylomonas sp. SURF-2]
MIIKTTKAIPASEITDPLVFQQRRKIVKALIAGALLPNVISSVSANTGPQSRWPLLKNSEYSTDRALLTPPELVKNYTNYYEFSFNKEDSTELAQNLPTDNWRLEVGGEVEKPGHYDLEEILRQHSPREYIYRFRCVEGWSMVIPWVGFPLADLLKQVKPLSGAKFVKFTAVHAPDSMPKQRIDAMLDWPYVEALRIDEAVHPLTILAVGMYGDVLPKQNGAAVRLVVPWKYGFKSIKAVVKIELLRKAPMTTWHGFAPTEYGFYANVNPSVPHPRWSQYSERRLGSGFFTPRRKTELYNGYGEQVAALYGDMDLRHFY